MVFKPTTIKQRGKKVKLKRKIGIAANVHAIYKVKRDESVHIANIIVKFHIHKSTFVDFYVYFNVIFTNQQVCWGFFCYCLTEC